MSTPHDHSAQDFAQALIDAWNTHDARKVADFFADDYEGEDVGLSGLVLGKRGVRRFVMYTSLGLPDIRFTAMRVIAQGPDLVLVWQATGTHTGKMLNIPPTGRVISYSGVTIFTLRDCKIIRSQRLWDIAGVLRQMGLLPELPEI
ncbi:MAG: ester cyclase [Anaerolineae bacterium]|nr:ester cyclase [Anaerolineae bacterium]